MPAAITRAALSAAVEEAEPDGKALRSANRTLKALASQDGSIEVSHENAKVIVALKKSFGVERLTPGTFQSYKALVSFHEIIERDVFCCENL